MFLEMLKSSLGKRSVNMCLHIVLYFDVKYELWSAAYLLVYRFRREVFVVAYPAPMQYSFLCCQSNRPPISLNSSQVNLQQKTCAVFFCYLLPQEAFLFAKSSVAQVELRTVRHEMIGLPLWCLKYEWWWEQELVGECWVCLK